MDIKNIKVGKTYQLKEFINRGAFGEVFRGVNEKNKIDVAIKLEPVSSKNPQLFNEYKLIQYLLRDTQGIFKGIPNVYHFSTEGDYNVMVMDLLGPSLADLFNICNKKFTLKTVIMIADQCLQRIEFMHTKQFLHRDIKPDNFLIGTEKNAHKVYCVDFGLAKRYIKKDGYHIEYKEGKSLTGTARYASINTHLGIEQGRRDDLESLGYMFLYFLRGSLPWQNLKAENKQDKYKSIQERKISISTYSIDILCKGLPVEFSMYLAYCRNLRFNEKPDYTYLRKLFKELFMIKRCILDYDYDWNLITKEINKKKQENDDRQRQQQIENQLKFTGGAFRRRCARSMFLL